MKLLIYSALLCSIFSVQAQFVSGLGAENGHNSIQRLQLVKGLQEADYKNDNARGKDAIEAEFFLQCRKGGVAHIEHLLSIGVSANITNKKGNTPLLHAIINDKKVIAVMLLEAGATIDCMVKTKVSDMSLLEFTEHHYGAYYELLKKYTSPEQKQDNNASNELELVPNGTQNSMAQWFSDRKKPLILGGVLVTAASYMLWKYQQRKNVVRKKEGQPEEKN